MPGIMDLLGGLSQQPATTEGDAFNMEIAKQLLNPEHNVLQPTGTNSYHATHWSQGVADMLRAIGGTSMANNSDRNRDQRANFDAPRVAGPSLPNIPPITSGQANQPVVRPNNPNQFNGALPPGFSEAPNDQGAVTNNDPERMNLGVPPPAERRSYTARNGTPLTEITGPSGAAFSVHSDHVDRFSAFLNDLHENGYNVEGQQSSGFADRSIRGTNRPSLHASGNAIDVNWTRNAEGTRGDIPADLARELARKHGLIWGGDFRGRSADPMHFEIDPNFRPENNALPVVQAADRVPQDTPPVQRDVNNQPVTRALGPGGNPIYNPDTDFQPTFPDPPPHDFGLTPNQMRSLNFQNADARKRIVEGLERQWTPQYTEMVGGKRWVVPATGQTGFIPEPKYGKLETAAGTIDTVTIHDRYGKRNTYTLSPTDRENNAVPAVAPTAPAQQAPVGPGAPAATPPIAPEAAPNAVVPPAATPPAAPNAPTLDNMPPLPGAPPAPNAPRKSWLDGPDFTRGREIAIEQGEKKVSADSRMAAREAPIKEAMETGDNAARTRSILDQLRALESTPGLDRLYTGPGSETILDANVVLEGALKAAGLDGRDPQMVAAGEALRKFSTMLGSAGARQLTNRPTQFDFQAFLKANPGMAMSAAGRRFLTETLTQLVDRDVAIGNAASAYRGPAENWPRERDRIARQYSPIVDGTVLDTVRGNIRFDTATGRIEFGQPVHGQIIGGRNGESFQYIGRTGIKDDNTQANWVKVDPRNPSTFRIQEMESGRKR